MPNLFSFFIQMPEIVGEIIKLASFRKDGRSPLER